MKSSSSLSIFVGIPLAIVLSLVYLPNFWIYVFLTADLWTSWDILHSPAFDMYHEFLISRLTEKVELPVTELHYSNFTLEELLKVSKDYTFPVVIKGAVADCEGVKAWSDPNWWLKKYEKETILCGTLNNVRENCTLGDFFSEMKSNKPFYISGASRIFDRNPELTAMVESPHLAIAEGGLGERKGTQIFMGQKDMGSDIHCAIGVNIFRQMAGVKKWWFIPPSQTPYLKPSINVNGFSAHTNTMVGKDGEPESPWLSKVVRYTAVLHPGDVLINPPWFWHGILNLGDSYKDLVIGVPTRYGGIDTAFKSNTMLSLSALSVLLAKKFQKGAQENFMDDLEGNIERNRLARMPALAALDSMNG